MIKKFLFFIFTVLILGVLHDILTEKEPLGDYPIFRIYSFLLPLSSISFLLCLWTYRSRSHYTGYMYIGCGMIKTFAGIIFLYPLISNPEYSKKFILIHYILAYFCILFIEVSFLTGILAGDDHQNPSDPNIN